MCQSRYWPPPWRLACIACLAAGVFLGLVQSAPAGQIIMASTSGAAGTWTALIPNSATPIGGSSGFMVTATISSNSPGNPTSGILLSSTTNISNLGTTKASLYLAYGADGYLSPKGTVSDLTSINNLPVIGGSTATITSWVNTTLASVGDPTNSWQSGNKVGPITSVNSQQSDSIIINALGSPYVINQLVVVNIDGLGTTNILGSTTITPAPEPASMTLFGVGLAGMVGYGWRKRRQQATAEVS